MNTFCRARPSAVLGSLNENEVGVEGVKMIAAVLKDTSLSKLRCAPPVSCPVVIPR